MSILAGNLEAFGGWMIAGAGLTAGAFVVAGIAWLVWRRLR